MAVLHGAVEEGAGGGALDVRRTPRSVRESGRAMLCQLHVQSRFHLVSSERLLRHRFRTNGNSHQSLTTGESDNTRMMSESSTLSANV